MRLFFIKEVHSLDTNQNTPNEAAGMSIQPAKEPDPNAMFAEVFDRMLRNAEEEFTHGEEEKKKS
jgi:hypothetical protein